MKAKYAAAAQENRAPAGSLRSPQFRRMVALSWPHRRLIFLGMMASIGYALFNAVSVAGLVPILKVLVSEEGLFGWADRTSAESRLGAELDVGIPADTPRTLFAEPPVVVRKTTTGSPLHDAGVDLGDLILTVNGRPVSGRACLRQIADAEPGSSIRLGFAPIEDPAAPPREQVVSLRDLPTRWRFGRWALSWIPPENTVDDKFRTLVYVLAAVCIAVIVSNVFRFFAQYFIAVGTFRAMMDLRRDLYRKVLRLPMSFFAHEVADLVSRFVQDVLEIQRGLMALFGRLLREPLRAAALFVLALILNWQLTLVMLVVAPGAIFLFWYVGRQIRRANRRLLRGYGMMLGALESTLHAMSIIKAYTAEHAERKRLWKIDRRLFQHQVRIAALEAFLKPMLEVIGILVITVVTAWLGLRVIRQEIQADEFASLVFVLAMMFAPLRNLGDLYGRVQRSAAGAQRIFAVLDAQVETEQLAGAVQLARLRDRIEFHDVHFTYPDAASPALNGVNLAVRQGEVVAIVGPNGSGKTTLMNLLLRFYDPQQGRITIDGTDVRDASLRSLRDQISLVTQDAVIFATTLADNIAYGAPKSSRETIESAARRAYADDFIQALPDNYDTVSGDRGVTLSGGQRQRIAIARAILRDAPILVFDEATSQIDTESEMRIQSALTEFSAGRTTFVIAHRLSTIKFADRIVVLDQGRVVDTGTHDALLERCPLYAMLCRTQLVE
jgi:ABC-type multidrug transport system fused ATPase/permease subunit